VQRLRPGPRKTLLDGRLSSQDRTKWYEAADELQMNLDAYFTSTTTAAYIRAAI